MKNKNPLISVIMNCFNGEKYLKDSITSLKKQSYKNWELIFWDNKSTDNSSKIVKNFKEKRIKYYKAKKFTNLHTARNLALKKAKGEYVSFLDCDDLLLKDKLRLQVQVIQENNFGLVYSNCYLFNKNTILKKKKISYKKLPEGNITNQLLKNYLIALPTILVKRKILNRIFFNEKYHIIGDMDLIMRISLNEKFGCVQSPLAIYRIHDNNYSGKNKMLLTKELEIWVKEFKRSYFNKSNLKKSSFHAIENKIKIHKQMYLIKTFYQKFNFLIKIFSNFNFFYLLNCFKILLPNKIKSKIFFYNW